MSNEIDYFGRVNGIDPDQFWKHGISLSEAEMHICLERWHSPSRTALRQGMTPILDLRDRRHIENERRIERSENDAIRSGALR